MESQIKQFARNTLRKNETDLVMPTADGKEATIHGVKITPKFAEMVENLITNFNNKQVQEYSEEVKKVEELQKEADKWRKIADMIEVWEPKDDIILEDEFEEYEIVFNPGTWAKGLDVEFKLFED